MFFMTTPSKVVYWNSCTIFDGGSKTKLALNTLLYTIHDFGSVAISRSSKPRFKKHVKSQTSYFSWPGFSYSECKTMLGASFAWE